MSKRCARCEKTVYPLEELKCLDKIWHKGCFKCQECSMQLNMKNYKGFNKFPYCEAHIPKPKATTMKETPELKRIAENTKIQSNAKYHADFEAAKGKFTQVADDPETLRIKQNTKIISNVAYHGDLEKKAEMEQKRTLTGENGNVPLVSPADPPNPPYPTPAPSAYQQQPPPPQHHPPPPQQHHQQQQQQQHHYQPQDHHQRAPPQHRAVTQIANQDHGQGQPRGHGMAQGQGQSPYSARQNATSTVIYTSQHGPVNHAPTKRVGSIADYDPMNDQYGSIAHPKQSGGYRSQQVYRTDPQQQHQPHHQPQQYPAHQPQVQPMQHPPAQKMGRCYRAMYDYDAADYDEVSFRDGDLIINCTPIDEGWMTGTVQRTTRTGMLPANYVEPVEL